MEKVINIYLRLIDYNGAALTVAGVFDNTIIDVQNTLDTKNAQFIPVESCSSGVEQTLHIGSQSTGTGAGKILFNAFTITKHADAASPAMFQRSASGTPFKTVEAFFVDKGDNLYFKQTYKLAAIKSISWGATSGHAGIMEFVAFEYGGLIVTSYNHIANGQINIVQNGWNAVKNVSDNDTSSPIS